MITISNKNILHKVFNSFPVVRTVKVSTKQTLTKSMLKVHFNCYVSAIKCDRSKKELGTHRNVSKSSDNDEHRWL